MTEFTLDLNLNHDPNSPVNYQPFDRHNPSTPISPLNTQPLDQQQRILTTAKTIPTTRNRRRSSDFIETANFLKACFLCKRRLIPGRDIYMYRGDSAFCTLECREQQMNIDEKWRSFHWLHQGRMLETPPWPAERDLMSPPQAKLSPPFRGSGK